VRRMLAAQQRYAAGYTAARLNDGRPVVLCPEFRAGGVIQPDVSYDAKLQCNASSICRTRTREGASLSAFATHTWLICLSTIAMPTTTHQRRGHALRVHRPQLCQALLRLTAHRPRLG
jgi:hypothetical protein